MWVNRLKAEVLELLKMAGPALLVAYVLTQVIFLNAYVPTVSMEPTIMAGDRLVATRYSYWFTKPERYDVLVFRYPDAEQVIYTKRVIGLPGDTVEIKDGLVYINQVGPMPSEFVKEVPLGSYGPYIVPEGSYFMMGDNRNSSLDSRYWEHTYLSEDKILGKVRFRYWPLIEKVE